VYEVTGWTRVEAGDPTAGFPTVRLRNVETGEYFDGNGEWGGTANAVYAGVATDGSWTPFAARFRTADHHTADDRYQVMLIHQGWSPLGARVVHDDVALSGPQDEECDDGNLTPGDGCAPTCLAE
jgi:cysteine-rich repeat protein